LDAVGLIEMATDGWEGFFATGGADERGEMTACGSADRAEVIGVEVVVLRMRSQPADGGLAVLDLRGEDGFLTETILDAGHSIAFEHEWGHGAGKFVPGTPAAAVDVDDERERFFGRCRGQVEVEHLRFIAAFDVGDVLLDFDGRGLLGEEAGGEKGEEEKELHGGKANRQVGWLLSVEAVKFGMEGQGSAAYECGNDVPQSCFRFFGCLAGGWLLVFSAAGLEENDSGSGGAAWHGSGQVGGAAEGAEERGDGLVA
jgi:hypothetical protein